MTKLVFDWDAHVVTPNTTLLPYGWKKDDFDPKQFKVDYELTPFIEEALQQVENGKSLRDAAAWLSVASNRYISHVGLDKLWLKVVQNPKETDRQLRLDTWRKPKTKEEKQRHKISLEKARARARITKANKTLARLSPAKKELEDERTDTISGDGDSNLPVYQDIPDEAQVIFKPNPGPQTWFLNSADQEVLYGGAAGGGKSYAILADPMRYFDHPKFNGLLLRRTNDELRELIRESQSLYKAAFPKAKWHAQRSEWTFPSGATLWMSYLDRDDDVLRYQGQAFTWIAIDELTQYSTPYVWNYLRSRLRSTAKDLPLIQRGTTNPGGPGHAWVKRMFVDPAPPNTSFAARDPETGQRLVYPPGHAKEGKPLFSRKFVPAKLSDNPYLAEDGQYEASLLSLPEQQRRQLLEGDWSIAQGAAFPEFRTDTHVCQPFYIPHEWRRFRSCDFGYSSHSAVLWFAVDPVWDRLVVYRELYVSKHTGKELAKRIVDIETEHNERMSYGILDSSVFHQRGNSGPVISEEMAAEGARFRPSDRGHGSRVAGRNRLHELLRVSDDSGMAGIVIFDNCRQLISDLQVIPTDPKGGDDIDDRFVSDHTYDALRYGIMSRPKPHSSLNEWGMASATKLSRRPADSTFGY